MTRWPSVVHVDKNLCRQLSICPGLHDPREVGPVTLGSWHVEHYPVPVERVGLVPLVPIDLILQSNLPLQASIGGVL